MTQEEFSEKISAFDTTPFYMVNLLKPYFKQIDPACNAVGKLQTYRFSRAVQFPPIENIVGKVGFIDSLLYDMFSMLETVLVDCFREYKPDAKQKFTVDPTKVSLYVSNFSWQATGRDVYVSSCSFCFVNNKTKAAYRPAT